MRIFDRLLTELPFSRIELYNLIRTAPHRYKVYKIPKRSGKGDRLIAQPTPELKTLQRWVAANILSKYPIHHAAVAYRPLIGIKDNAKLHSRQEYLLKMDFQDFFPSINAQDFSLHTEKYAPQLREDISVLQHILFRKPKRSDDFILSIGAPSSPLVSNTILYDFDETIGIYAKERKIVYTRYADDLIFSTNERGALRETYEHVKAVCKQLQYPGLTLNFDKTVFSSRKWNRTVTGLVLTNDQNVSIGWGKKRELRIQIHHYLMNKLSPMEIANLRGYLAFVRDVEPALFEKFKNKVPIEQRKDLFG